MPRCVTAYLALEVATNLWDSADPGRSTVRQAEKKYREPNGCLSSSGIVARATPFVKRTSFRSIRAIGIGTQDRAVPHLDWHIAVDQNTHGVSFHTDVIREDNPRLPALSAPGLAFVFRQAFGVGFPVRSEPHIPYPGVRRTDGANQPALDQVTDAVCHFRLVRCHGLYQRRIGHTSGVTGALLLAEVTVQPAQNRFVEMREFDFALAQGRVRSMQGMKKFRFHGMTPHQA
jgi:hypothetical protein